MDSFDSNRSPVPARMPAPRQVVPSSIRGGAAHLPEAAASPLSLRVALRGARRYWWLVLMLWAVGSAGIGAGIYLKVKPSYKATSRLRVDPSSDNIYGIARTESLEAYQQTQSLLITSSNVLTNAAANPSAAIFPRIRKAGDAVQELAQNIVVGVIPNTYLIDVSMTSPDPAEAAALVNAVVKAFMEANVEWSTGATKLQIRKLEDYLDQLKGQSTAFEDKWKEVVKRGDNGSQIRQKELLENGEVRAQNVGLNRGTITMDEYRRVREELNRVIMDLAQAEAVVATVAQAAQQAADDPTPALDESRLQVQVDRQFKNDPEVVAFTARMHEARNKLADIQRITPRKDDPAFRRANNIFESLKAQYERMYVSKSAEIRGRIQAPGGPVEQAGELRAAESRATQLRVQHKTLRERFEKLRVDTQKMATDDVDITVIRDERESLKAMQEMVNRRLEQLRFESKGEERIRVVTSARVSGQAISDNRVKFLAIAPVGVLGAVLGLIVMLEVRSGRVADPEALSTRLRHEVFSIAPLPDLRSGPGAADGRSEQKLARFVQSLDHLRVALCEAGGHGQGRCVMITSATGGEGKTTLSAHLAARCANAGTMTLLVDADLRRASLGRLLDVPAGPGLGDILAGDVDLDGAMITEQAGGFHFLSAGTPGRDPSRVMKSDRLSDLIGRLRHSYDLVIIDTPPVLPVADALILGRWTDGAVVAARFDASRLPLLERANRQLALAGIPVLGVVVNGVRGHDAAYGNYAYSYNYPGRDSRAADDPRA